MSQHHCLAALKLGHALEYASTPDVIESLPIIYLGHFCTLYQLCEGSGPQTRHGAGKVSALRTYHTQHNISQGMAQPFC